MKRANLYVLVCGVMFSIALSFGLSHAQQSTKDKDQSYVYLNRLLSDFGDGYDQSKSIVWKPAYSEYVVQVKGAENTVTQDQVAANPQGGADTQVIVQGKNPDPERNAVRYSDGKPDGITDVIAGPQKFVLGLKAEFSRQGYNWVELRPHRIGSAEEVAQAQTEANVNAETATNDTTAGAAGTPPDLSAESSPFELPFTGKAYEISLWTWGGNYAWWVEVYVRDYLGYQYRLPMGDLLYKGWKQKRVEIPRNIPQEGQRIPAKHRLSFEMIKLWSFPSERVNQFYVYFDLLQYGSRISTDSYNGSDLAEDVW